MIQVMQKIKLMLGIALCIAGFAGTLVPIIPGVPMIIAGFALMGGDHPFVRGVKARVRRCREWIQSNRVCN